MWCPGAHLYFAENPLGKLEVECTELQTSCVEWILCFFQPVGPLCMNGLAGIQNLVLGCIASLQCAIPLYSLQYSVIDDG